MPFKCDDAFGRQERPSKYKPNILLCKLYTKRLAYTSKQNGKITAAAAAYEY